MPQEFHVLRCFSCEVFQVHIVKKDKKWQCKMCGAKQSLKRNYGKGSAKDCRAQVMKLNELRMSKADGLGQIENESCDETLTDELIKSEPNGNKTSISKWSDYLDEIEPVAEEENEVEEEFLVTEVQKNRKKRFMNNHPYKCERTSNKKHPAVETSPTVNSKLYRGEKTSYKRNTEIETSAMADPVSSLNFLINEVEDLENSVQKRNIEKKDNFQFQSKETCGAKSSAKSKYSKYLDDEETESDQNVEIEKKTNIFNSDPDDLDALLDF